MFEERTRRVPHHELACCQECRRMYTLGDARKGRCPGQARERVYGRAALEAPNAIDGMARLSPERLEATDEALARNEQEAAYMVDGEM